MWIDFNGAHWSYSGHLFSLVHPVLPPPILPVALPLHALLVEVDADTALLTAVPTALVHAAILPDELALAVALVFLELSDVLLAIRPNQVSMPMHLVVEPVSGVLF